MTPDELKVGAPYPGPMHENDGAVFEFSKEGPELRLFFAHIPEEAVRVVETEDCYLGLMRAGDVAVVPWKIGEQMMGDAQFHVFLYPPETRPATGAMRPDQRLKVRILLVDRSSGLVRAVRSVTLSTWLSQELSEAIAYQLGNHIGREEYDAQISAYQTRYPEVRDAIEAADIFEKAEG